MNQTTNNNKIIKPTNLPIPPYHYQDDEITLKELLLKIQEFWQEVWTNKFLIILMTSIFAIAFLANTWRKEVTYTADLSFMLTEESNSKGVRDTDLLGLGEVNFNLDKISFLTKSSKIIYKALLKKVTINNKEDFIANHLIDIYGLHQSWQNEGSEKYKEFSLKDFSFVKGIKEDYTRKEQRALKILQELTVNNLLSVSYNKSTEVFVLKATTLNEVLSTELVDNVYEALIAFYVDKTVGRPQKTYELLTLRTDSLSQLLNQAERQLAMAKDRTAGLIGSTYQVTMGQLNRQVAQTNARYMQALKNKEAVEYILQNRTPDFQIIDRTFIPILNAESKLNALLLGGFLGIFLGTLYVIGRKIVRDALV